MWWFGLGRVGDVIRYLMNEKLGLELTSGMSRLGNWRFGKNDLYAGEKGFI